MTQCHIGLGFLRSCVALAVLMVSAVSTGVAAADVSASAVPSPVGPTATCSPGDQDVSAGGVYRSPEAAYNLVPGKLVRGSLNQVLVELDPPLPAGRYTLRGGSYDGYDGRARTPPQLTESWVAEFRSNDGRLLATSRPSEDLLDGPGYNEANWEGSLGEVFLGEQAGRIEVRHVHPVTPGSNSVHVVCLGVAAVVEPTLGSILRAGGLTEIAEVSPPFWPAGPYEIQLLAEFSTGHATNAVGTYRRSTTICDVKVADEAGGPGFIDAAAMPFDIDHEFGLCLSGAGPAVLYSNLATNPGEAPAVRAFRDLTHPNSYLIGFEDDADGDFQDLVLRLTQRMPVSPLPGLPDGWPRQAVPWDRIDDDWLLGLVHGELIDGRQPQGLYLVSPDGERWVAHAEMTEPQAGSLAKILDWSSDAEKALVLITGPRDIQRIDTVDLKTGRRASVSGNLGPDAAARGSFVGDSDNILLFDAGVDPVDQLIEVDNAGAVVSTYGPPFPGDTEVDWVNTVDGSGIVVFDDLEVGSARGHVIGYQRSGEEESVLALADCVPVRWLRSEELVAACTDVQPTTGTQLWVISLDDAAMWPVVDPDALRSENIGGADDLYVSDGSVFFESTADQVFRLDDGCRVPIRLTLPPGASGGDLVGVIDGNPIVHSSGRLVKVDLAGQTAQDLLAGVIDVARRDATPLATGSIPTLLDERQALEIDACDQHNELAARALLTKLRWGRHPDFTRVVIVFDEDTALVPGWFAEYLRDPIHTELPPGPTITGGALIQVLLTPSSTVDPSDPSGNVVRTYVDPTELVVGDGTVETITLTEDLDAVLSWVIRLAQRSPYRAFSLSGPPRLVIDIGSGP